MNRACSVMLIMIFSGCATQVPAPISKIPAYDYTVAEVRAEPERFLGSMVRWGGVISRVENKASRTWIEVVSRELRKNGQPLTDSRSSGRFIASFPGFMDPIVYKPGALLTVAGGIEGETVGLIGEYVYAFPVVTVSAAYLWPEKDQAVYHEYSPSPWGHYDPWPYHRRSYPPYRW